MPAFIQESSAMSLLGISFVYVFLPLSLFCYYIIPYRLRPAALLWITLAYFLLAQPWSVPMIIVCVLLDYLAVRMMEHKDDNPAARKYWLGFIVVKNLLLVILTGRLWESGVILTSLGVAVYCVSSLDMVLTFYRRESAYERNILRIGLHCLFFPRMYAGPMQPYREFAPQLAQIHFNFRSLTVGLGQFVQGGLKVALFGRYCGALFVTISEFPASEVTVLSLWSMAALFAFWIYFTLSGYCDMAQGIGAMFGIFLPKNYYYPYQSRDMGDFLDRFNMTVTAFLRRNVPEHTFGLLLTGMLLGLWFGFRPNYLLWGMFLAALVLLERQVFARMPKMLPTLIRRVLTFSAVLFSFALMAAPTVGEALLHMHGMLGLGGYQAYNEMIMHQLSANWIILLLALFFSTNIVNILVLSIHRSLPRLMDVILTIANTILLVLLTAIIY